MDNHSIRKTCQKSPFRVKGCKIISLGSWRLEVCNSETVWDVANRTAPRCAVNDALHDGVNILVYKSNSKRSVFSDPYLDR